MERNSRAIYEIRVRGVLGETLCSAFRSMVATSKDGDTVFSGCLVDQVALHGVLNQIDSLGLDLVAVQRIT